MQHLSLLGSHTHLAACHWPWDVGNWSMKFLTLSATVIFSIVAIIAFFSNQIMGILSLAAAGACLATWFVYKKQAK